MADKVAKAGITREKGYLYYLDKQGDISRAKMARGGKKGGKPGKVTKLGIKREEGFLYFISRKDEMIKTSGYRVSPTEIEEVLYEHEAVAEAAVIGIPHESHGEEVKAFVSLAPGARSTPEELQAFCKDRLAAYKYPRIVEIIERLGLIGRKC